MQQAHIRNFLERYFTTNDCTIEDSSPGHMTVQLTVNMDKQLMNRPFYWHYLEKTGGSPNPMKLTLVTNQDRAPDHIKGEVIHFGSPRLHQIFSSTKELAAHIRLYENITLSKGQQVPLQPWLALNVKVSYQCDRKKDRLFSIGLNLINGQMIEDFYSKTASTDLTPKIPDYSFTLTPLIKPNSGVKRIQQSIINTINQDDHSWADLAMQRWKDDINLLNHFYEGLDEKPESYYIEEAALKEQYEPKIIADIINGGLFYFTPNAFAKLS